MEAEEYYKPIGAAEAFRAILIEVLPEGQVESIYVCLRFLRILFGIMAIIIIAITEIGLPQSIHVGHLEGRLILIATYVLYAFSLEILGRMHNKAYHTGSFSFAFRSQIDIIMIMLFIYLSINIDYLDILLLLLAIPTLSALVFFRYIYIDLIFLSEISLYILFFNISKYGYYENIYILMIFEFITILGIIIGSYWAYRNILRSRQMKKLHDATVNLLGTLPYREIAQVLADAAKAGVPAAEAAIVHQFQGGDLLPCAASSIDITSLGKRMTPVGVGIEGIALQSRQIINVPEVSMDHRFITALDTATLRAVGALLVVPICFEEERIGTISVRSRHQGVFTSEHERFLSILAASGAAAWMNAELRADQNTRRTDIARVLAAARTLGENSSLELLVGSVANAVQECTNFHAVTVYLIEGDQITPKATAGIPSEAKDQLGVLPSDVIAPYLRQGRWSPEYHSVYVHQDRQSSDQVWDHLYAPPPDEPDGEAWQAHDLLLAPLETTGGELMGYIHLTAPEGRKPPSLDELQQLDVLATLAANAIRNMLHLSDISQQHNRTRMLLATMAGRASRPASLDELYAWIIDLSRHIVPASEYHFYSSSSPSDVWEMASRYPPQDSGVGSALPTLRMDGDLAVKLMGSTMVVRLSYAELASYADPTRSAHMLLAPEDRACRALSVLIQPPGTTFKGILIVVGSPNQNPFGDNEAEFMQDIMFLASAEIQQYVIRDNAISTARIAERRRLENGIHDAKNGLATGVRWAAEATRDAVRRGDSGTALENLTWLEASRSECAKLLTYALEEIRDPKLERYGLLSALRMHAQTLSSTRIHVQGSSEERLGPEQISFLYTIARELINNASIHSGFAAEGSSVQIGVRLEVGEVDVKLAIWDDGIGFDVASMWADRLKWGLRNTLAAIEDADGRMSIESTPGRGTEVHVVLPLKRALAEPRKPYVQ